MALNKNKNLKLYYSIGEVASMFGVTETLLRFWEKEFPSIKPQKAGRGIRQYTRDDIDVTLEGARQALKENREGTDVKIEVLDRLKSIRDELQEISKEMNYLS